MKLTASVPQISTPSSATSANPYNCPNVATTFSLATKPVILATAAFHSPQPSGVKIQANVCPIVANKLLLISSTIANPLSSNPNDCKNQITIVDNKITVPAFLIKDHPLSHILLKTFNTLGA